MTQPNRSSFLQKQTAQRSRTPTDDLRDVLHDLESRVGRIKHSEADELLAIPPLFDRAHALLAQMEERGADLRAEQTRLETLSDQFRGKRQRFLRSLDAGALAEARTPAAPPEDNWWWYIDDLVAEENRIRRGRLLRSLAMGLLFVAALAFLYNRFLAPDPATRQRVAHQLAAEASAQDGDYAAALHEITQALELAPGDPGLLTWRGALEATLGDTEAATVTLVAAEAAYSDRERFLLTLAQAYLSAGQPQPALEACQAAIELNPQSASAYLYMGTANEMLEDWYAALKSYETASQIALDIGDDRLNAMARTQYANLLMQGPPMTLEPEE